MCCTQQNRHTGVNKAGLAEYLSWVNFLEVLLILTGKYLKKLVINYIQGKFLTLPEEQWVFL